MSKDLSLCLHDVLANERILTIKSQMYHWNVTGCEFYSLHQLFQKVYEYYWEAQDSTAENIRKIKFFINFEKISMENSELDLTNFNEKDSKVMLKNLCEDLKKHVDLLNKSFEVARSVNDEAIMNYLAEQLDGTKKLCWFLRASIKE